MNFSIQTLNKAVRASTDKPLRLHWLKEIDQLAPEIVKQQKDLKYDNTTFICLAAEDYAMLGMYQKSLDLMQERGCNRSPRPDEQYSRNLAQVFRVASVRNDIGHVIKMIPVRVKDPNQEFLNHIPPVIYGLVRIGRYKDALEYLKQLEQASVHHHEAQIDLIAEIGIIAKDDFPIEDWIAEIDIHRNKLSLSQWDTYRILFSICARIRGVKVATEFAEHLPLVEIAAARIGIAEGLRGYSIEPTYTFYQFK